MNIVAKKLYMHLIVVSTRFTLGYAVWVWSQIHND